MPGRSTAQASQLQPLCGLPSRLHRRHRRAHQRLQCRARAAGRIDIERAALRPLPRKRTADYEKVGVYVTSSGGFIGGTELMTLPRGRAHLSGKYGYVISYHHAIHSIRRKLFRQRRTCSSTALLDLVYRHHLFPREAYHRTFEALLEKGPEGSACRVMVELFALAHDRACESELADSLTICLDAGQLPDAVRRTWRNYAANSRPTPRPCRW